jgi:Ca-activated chloride channel family protein
MSHAIPMITDDEMNVLNRGCEPGGFGSLRTERGLLPLVEMRVDTRIVGLAYTVTLEQTFQSAISEPMEATYIFPLPDRAGVTRFRMEVNGRIVEGDIKERGQARREYDQAIQSGHRAAITEEERSGVFTMRVGNLMPNERAKVTLVMTGPVIFDDGEATFRFPLVVAPRYIPGRALGENVGDGTAMDTNLTPDASRISPPVLLPGFPNPVRLAIEVSIDGAGLPISDLRTSLFSSYEEQSGAVRRLRIQPGERLNRDFVLRFKVPAANVKSALYLVPDADQQAGTFLLTIVPPATAAADRPRDVVFVLDRSGSMEGWKMVAARRAVARMVDTLRSKDNFAVYAFDDSIETPSGNVNLVPATDRNRFQAVEMLAKLESRGGTEMLQPLVTAAKSLGGGYHDRDRVIVLATDGQVGNEDHILRQLGAEMKNVRVFTLGIDRAVNEGFLKRLAALGGGLAEIVESEDRLDEVMDKIHRRIGTPIVSEVAVAPSGLDILPGSTAPSRIPDLFAGAPVIVGGRYRGPANGRVTVTGRDAYGRSYVEETQGTTIADPSLTTIWARAHVRDLEDRFVVGRGDKKQLEREIVETSVRFRVLSRFTAFIAIDRAEVVNAGGNHRQVVQPVEAPEGWEMFESGGKDSSRTRSGVVSKAVASFGASAAGPGSAGGGAASKKARLEITASAVLDLGGDDQAPMAPMEQLERRVAPAPRAMRPQKPMSAPAMPPPPPLAQGRARDEALRRAPVQAIELTPYRQRAAMILDGYRKAHDRSMALMMLEAQLRTLLEDLRSIGADAAATEDLERFLAALSTRAPNVETQLVEALDRFAQGANVAGTPGERRDFWK